MRVMIPGAGGMLGQSLVRRLQGKVALFPLSHSQCDITDAEEIRDSIERSAPDVIVNCAAVTNVDWAEQHPEVCRHVNAEGAGNLAMAARDAGCRLIHLSTDYVFDGVAEYPYVESDDTHPVNLYGAAKLQAEDLIADSGADALILRTGWLYGTTGKNMVATLLEQLANGGDQSISVVDDQIGSPTWVDDLARQIGALVHSSLRGVYHCAAEGAVSRYELALRLAERLGKKASILPVPTSSIPRPAQRPLRTPLNCAKLQASSLWLLPTCDESIDRFASSLRHG